MLQEVFPNIYLNEIPLPNNPLKALNSYILMSDTRNIIIDTGFNIKACKDAMMQGILELKLDLAQTDLVLTHMHADHTGLADDLRKLGCRVLIGKKDGEILNRFRATGDRISEKMFNALDLDQDGQNTFSQKEFGKNTSEVFEYDPLAEGDILNIGPYVLEVIDIPGHSPGHIGLYERKEKIFFGGDHILNEITPNITFWSYEYDSLGAYLASLKKIHGFQIDWVLPAHRSLIKDYRQRIEELIDHHQERLAEVMAIIREGEKTASQTAAEMHWDLSYDHWDDFPGTQKYFAAGEAMSHLEHLVFAGIAQRVKENGTVYYRLS